MSIKSLSVSCLNILIDANPNVLYAEVSSSEKSLTLMDVMTSLTAHSFVNSGFIALVLIDVFPVITRCVGQCTCFSGPLLRWVGMLQWFYW